MYRTLMCIYVFLNSLLFWISATLSSTQAHFIRAKHARDEDDYPNVGASPCHQNPGVLVDDYRGNYR